MGAKASTNNVHNPSLVPGSSSGSILVQPGSTQRHQSGQSARLRTQSSTSPHAGRRSSAGRLAIYVQNNSESSSSRYDRYRARSVHFDYGNGSSDGEDSDDDSGGGRSMISAASRRQTAALRAFLTQSVLLSGLRCPLCKQMSNDSDDFQAHVINCLTKPRLSYNADRLEQDRHDECVICFEDFLKGELIARLPCLCIYHKHCIDDWFKVNRTCPQHPNASATDFESSTLLEEEPDEVDDESPTTSSATAARPQSSNSNDAPVLPQEAKEVKKVVINSASSSHAQLPVDGDLDA